MRAQQHKLTVSVNQGTSLDDCCFDRSLIRRSWMCIKGMHIACDGLKFERLKFEILMHLIVREIHLLD